MEQIETYVGLLGIIVVTGQVFRRSPIPIALILVIIGMALSLLPFLPTIKLNSEVVLNLFLPLLIYEISSFSSWRDVKKNLRPIVMLSVGHVIFITIVVAFAIHALIPALSWPLAFVLGTVVSPPDDVAIVSIAEKIRMPDRVFTILEGEGMFNDIAALTLFRFALAAVFTHQFFIIQAMSVFVTVIIGEMVYGLALGYFIGKLRRKISNPILHIILSVITPFIAYLPAVQLGGCGVLATAATGFIIGNHYSLLFTPKFRLISRAVWPALAFAIQGLVFLLVGLDSRAIFKQVDAMPLQSLALYSISLISIVIIGRFIWVYGAVFFLPRMIFPSIRKKDPDVPWQYPFLISWAGMRGGISLAAVLAIPSLSMLVEGVNARDLLIFLVFIVIIATLVLQGLTLPWLIKVIGIQQFGQNEKHQEHMVELHARTQMAKSALEYLIRYRDDIKDEEHALLNEITLVIRRYRLLLTQLKERIDKHDMKMSLHSEKEEAKNETHLSSQLIKIERKELLNLWRDEKISLSIRNKLLEKLDHQIAILK
jgi:Na+/H+ antiporter